MALWCHTCLRQRGSHWLTCSFQDLSPLSSDQLDSRSSQRMSESTKEHKSFHSPCLRIIIQCLQTFLQQALQPQRKTSYFRHHCHEKVMTELSKGCGDLRLCSSGALRGSEEHQLWELDKRWGPCVQTAALACVSQKRPHKVQSVPNAFNRFGL